jgi:hypothetical protein
VAPVTYTVATGGSKLAVQRTPKTGNITRYLYNGSGVGVICQVNNGGPADGLTSTTWNALCGGGWVYNTYLTTPALGSDGYSPGIRHCGTTANPSRYSTPPRAPGRPRTPTFPTDTATTKASVSPSPPGPCAPADAPTPGSVTGRATLL